MKRSLFFFLATAFAAQTTALAGASSDLPEKLDLDTVLSLALEHNHFIRQARSRYEEAGGVVTEARSGRLPLVSLNAGYSRIDEGRFETGGGQPVGNPDSWRAGIEASQTLYSGGAVGSSIRSSEASQLAAAADFEVSVQAALITIREQFYRVLLAREEVQVQEQFVQLLEEELADANARVNAGTGSPFDRLRAEVSLANGQPPLIRARNAYRLAAVDLLRAIGLPSETGVEDRVVGTLEMEEKEYVLDSLLAAARENRPELVQLEQIVIASEETVDTAKAGSRPTVAVVAGYDVQNSNFSNDIVDTVDGWNVGIQGRWAIFDGKSTRGRVAQARSRVDQARLNYEEVALLIDAEVRRAYLSYLDAQELVAASVRVIEQAEESLRLARARSNAGAATQLDVLQTQVALTEARSNQARAYHDVTVALARLRRAAGLEPMPTAARLTQSETIQESPPEPVEPAGG
jgi:outer membrane protein TolC